MSSFYITIIMDRYICELTRVFKGYIQFFIHIYKKEERNEKKNEKKKLIIIF